jgi:hypothetical protein
LFSKAARLPSPLIANASAFCAVWRNKRLSMASQITPVLASREFLFIWRYSWVDAFKI